MIKFDRCTVCGRYDFVDGHRCPPKWECRGDWQDDDEWCVIYASAPGQAAETYAEHYDTRSADYTIINRRGGDTIILVRRYGADEVERYAIEGEVVPTYHATKIAHEARP